MGESEREKTNAANDARDGTEDIKRKKPRTLEESIGRRDEGGRRDVGSHNYTIVFYALVPLTFCDSHCSPSNRPSPVVAQLHASAKSSTRVLFVCTHLGWTYHERSRILCKPSFSVTSAGDMAGDCQRQSFLLHELFPRAGAALLLTTLNVLLVGKHHQQAVLHLPVRKNALQLESRLIDTVTVRRVNDEDETLENVSFLPAGSHPPEYRCNSVARVDESCPALRRPTH